MDEVNLPENPGKSHNFTFADIKYSGSFRLHCYVLFLDCDSLMTNETQNLFMQNSPIYL